MTKAAAWALILLVFLSSASVGLATAVREVDTSVSISVPSTTDTNKTIDIIITIQPPPPAETSQTDKVILTIISPNGVTDNLPAMPIGEGRYFWSLMINHLGNYTFQCIYNGEYSTDGTIYFKPSQSPVVQMTALGDAVPPLERDGGSWASTQPMREARGGLGLAMLNDRLYAIGGYLPEGYYYSLNPTKGFVATNEEYNPANNSWTAKAPMPTARAHFAIAACNGKIYCINSALVGFKLDEIYHLFPSPIWAGTNEAYNPATDTWETKASMPVAMPHAHANVVDEKIYIMDGNVNWMYDPTNDSWTTKAQASIPVSGFPSAVVGEDIYFIGSYQPIQIYHAANDSWSQGARTPRLDIAGKASAVSSPSTPIRIYLFTVAPYGWVPYGKTDTSGPARRTTFVYNPQTDNWSAGTQSPDYRVEFSTATLNEKVYLIGGFSFDNLPSNNVTARAETGVFTPIGYHSVTPTPTTVPTNGAFASSQTSQTEPILLPAVLGTAAIIVIATLVFWQRKRR